MAKTASDFIGYIRDSAYPKSLSDVAIERAFNEAQIDMGQASPEIKSGQFNVVSGKSEYDVFNRHSSDPAPDELVDVSGFRVFEVAWSIQPDHSSDPFFQGPFLGPYNGRPIIPFSSTTMWRPSDAIIFESDLSAVHQEFFDSQFEQLDSDPGSPIVLTPTPGADGVAYVRYFAYRSQAEYLQRAEFAYSLFAESRVCRAMARSKASVAGAKFSGIEDTGISMKFWSSEASRLEKDAKFYLERVGFAELPAASRSDT